MITPHRPIVPGDVARHYDELDTFYREIWGDHVHHGLWQTGEETPEQAAQQLVEHVAEIAAIQPGQAVCDVGCGYGATARWLAAARRARVTGLTISPRQHRYAQTHEPASGPPPDYLLQDWMHTTLPDEAFDAVLFIESLAHMDDKPRALRTAYRVLRPGGRLVACTWLAAPDAPVWARRLLLEPICREGQLPGLPFAADYHTWLADAGFETVRYSDISHNVQRTWTVVIRRVLHALVTRAAYRRYLLDRAQPNRNFALTVLRLWIAFRVRAFRYGLFAARKPM